MQKWIRIILAAVIVAIAAIGVQLFMKNNEGDGGQAVRMLTDSTGTQIEIPSHPKRVVILNASNLDLYAAAGGLEEVVGKPTSTSFSPDLAEKIKGIEEIGLIHQPNTEKIIALKPDLVIGVNVPFHNGLRETLKQAGIPLYINELNRYEDVLDTLKLYGELTGKPDAAKQVIETIQADYDRAAKLAEGKTPEKSVIIFGAPGSFNMATSQSFSGELLKRLNGINIADSADSVKGPYTALSMEYIAKADPQNIFIIAMGADPASIAQFREEMNSHAIWRDTQAVKRGTFLYSPIACSRSIRERKSARRWN